jgi:hypothetical protein
MQHCDDAQPERQNALSTTTSPALPSAVKGANLHHHLVSSTALDWQTWAWMDVNQALG